MLIRLLLLLLLHVYCYANRVTEKKHMYSIYDFTINTVPHTVEISLSDSSNSSLDIKSFLDCLNTT